MTGPASVPALRRPRATYIAMARGEDIAPIRPYLVAHERAHGLEVRA
ncbi:hypothetical protein [Streptomyces sp. NPDC054765]